MGAVQQPRAASMHLLQASFHAHHLAWVEAQVGGVAQHMRRTLGRQVAVADAAARDGRRAAAARSSVGFGCKLPLGAAHLLRRSAPAPHPLQPKVLLTEAQQLWWGRASSTSSSSACASGTRVTVTARTTAVCIPSIVLLQGVQVGAAAAAHLLQAVYFYQAPSPSDAAQPAAAGDAAGAAGQPRLGRPQLLQRISTLRSAAVESAVATEQQQQAGKHLQGGQQQAWSGGGGTLAAAPTALARCDRRQA